MTTQPTNFEEKVFFAVIETLAAEHFHCTHQMFRFAMDNIQQTKA